MSNAAVIEVTANENNDLRAQILQRPRIKGKLLEVSEWDVTVELRSMSIAQKGELIKEEEITPQQALSFLPEVIVFTCYNPKTEEPVFTMEDLDWLRAEPASVIEQVATESLAVSGLSQSAGDEGKDDL